MRNRGALPIIYNFLRGDTCVCDVCRYKSDWITLFLMQCRREARGGKVKGRMVQRKDGEREGMRRYREGKEVTGKSRGKERGQKGVKGKE